MKRGRLPENVVPGNPTFRIFISAVSGELRSYREEVARVLRRKGLHVCVQEDFHQSPHTLLEKLRAYIESCHALVALIGERCGEFPSDEHASVLGLMPIYDQYRARSGQSRASYTQWEYLLGMHFNKDIYRFLTASEGFAPDQLNPETVELQTCQLAFRQWLKETGIDRDPLTTKARLIEDILVLPFPDLARPKPCHLPYDTLGELFIGRDEFLRDLRKRFEKARQQHRWPNQGIHGLGGVGKTRAAVEYAWRHQGDYTALLFVNGENADALHRDLAGLAGVLQLSLHERVTDPERAEAVLGWLKAHAGWLLIVDNVDDHKARDAVAALLAQWSAGHVLITGRWSQWSKDVEPLDLHVLAEDDAGQFLVTSTDNARAAGKDDAAEARALAKDLGCLCLALEQASAYICDLGLSFAEYRRRWRNNAKNVRAWADKVVMKYHEEKEVPLSIVTTWQTTFDQLTPPARSLLQMLAWLSPEPQPLGLFDTEAATELLDAGTGKTRPDPELALAELRRYSLLQRASEANFDTPGQVHRLVQLITRERQTPQEQQATLTAALALVNDYAWGDPGDVSNWALWDPLAPHVQALVQHSDAAGISTPTTRLLNELGLLYVSKARFAEAEPLYRRALQLKETSLGLDHPDVATDLNNLAVLLRATNRLTEAEPLYRRALQIGETSFGPNHPKVAIRLNNLAILLQATNRLAEAEPLYRRALQIDELSFGPDHPEVATDLNNLAGLLRATNRLVEAELLYRRALQIDEKSFGPHHPCVARDLSVLASLLRVTDRLAEAEPMCQRALQITEASFGPNHPEVATDLSNLGLLLQARHRPSEAEPLHRRALKIDEASFGANHPEVARDLNNLAEWLRAANRFSEAEPLYRRALQIDEASFGPHHPNVGKHLHNLALLLLATNRLAEAEPLCRRALEVLVAFAKATGFEHPRLQETMKDYQLILARSGESESEVSQRVKDLE